MVPVISKTLASDLRSAIDRRQKAALDLQTASTAMAAAEAALESMLWKVENEVEEARKA